MLEIHLQGVTSVQASDFMFEPAATTVAVASEAIDPVLAAMVAGEVVAPTTSAADTSSGRIVSDDTPWSLPAQDVSFNFHFMRDGIEPIGLARFASLGDFSMFVTEERDDDADFASAIGTSIELDRSHNSGLAVGHFSPDQPQIHAGVAAPGEAAVTSPEPAIGHTPLNASIVAARHDEHEAARPSGNGPDPSPHGGSQPLPHAASEAASHNPPSESNSAATPDPEHARPSSPGHVDVANTPEPGENVHSKSEIAHSVHAETSDLHAATEAAPHNPNSASNPSDPGPDHPHPAAVARADVPDPPELGDSFHFKSVHAENPDAPDSSNGKHPQSSIVQDGGSPGPNGAAVHIAGLSPAAPHGAAHAEQHADHVAAVHAAHAHDLIV